ncbi:Exodeoxyribonuclease VII small subunit [Lutibaculum baratangense AMV1]|uniref:Exodeoxyribonuclease 7 small subunit n=2 Tax=Lutibaculum TaxID=1358438 RepID=V4RNG5_9HYPH|nr:Exodeoxyribonuclease VII small subunit [Lutibaculum baratangense AMV1]
MTDRADPIPDDVAAMSFEEALAELEKIVGRLEKGNVALEESIAIYTRGDALKKHCDRLLRQAEMRVEKIAADAEGRPTGVEPLDVG